MLIGKPLLEQVHVIHEYSADAIILPHRTSYHCIPNFSAYCPLPIPCLPMAIQFPSSSKFVTSQVSTSNKPTAHSINNIQVHKVSSPSEPHIEEPPELIAKVQHVDNKDDEDDKQILGEVPDLVDSALPDDIFTRLTSRGPFYSPRVNTISNAVHFGHLSQEQLQKAQALVVEFADIFVLSIREVKPVDFTKFHLQIPQDAIFSRKVHQRPLTQPQRKYLFPVLDDMRRAGITRFIPADEVKAVASTVLVQKTHSGTSLSFNDIRQIVNQQCVALGEPLDHTIDMESIPVITPKQVDPSKVKWRICQNFRDVNKVSNIAATPQGDIAAKQQCLVGHEFICVLDFAAGFYAIPWRRRVNHTYVFTLKDRGMKPIS